MRIIIIGSSLNIYTQEIIDQYPNNVIGLIEAAPRNYIPKKSKFPFNLINISKLRLLANNKKIDYFYLHKNNELEAQKFIKDLSPDVVFIYSMSQLLSEAFINIPKLGCINLHPSLLPSYRGPNPLFWIYYNQENSTGITLHFVDKGEDTGDIIFQRKFKIVKGQSGDLLNKEIEYQGKELFLKAIKYIENKIALPRIKQSKNSPSLRARNLTLEQEKDIIDWNKWDIISIWHFLKGTSLYFKGIPQPKGILQGHTWQIESYEENSISKRNKIAIGKVIKIRNKYKLVCKDGFINLSIKVSLKIIIKHNIKRIIKLMLKLINKFIY